MYTTGLSYLCDQLNERVEASLVGRYFMLKERHSTFTTEMRAGVVTFVTVAYVLAVNASILVETGGSCDSYDCCPGTPWYSTTPNGTVPVFTCRYGAVGSSGDPCYMACFNKNKASIIAATAVSSLIATFLMGAAANLPLAVAPGMGINAYFTFTVVGRLGSGNLTYGQALAACFVEGWIFLLLSVLGIRARVMQLVPRGIMLATAGGIGLFLAFIGLQSSEGLAVVGYEPSTLVTLAGCSVGERMYQYTPANVSALCATKDSDDQVINATYGYLDAMNLGPRSDVYQCRNRAKLQSGSMWLGVAGGLLMVVLLGREFRGAVLIGILFVTFISWIPNQTASYLGPSSEIPGGEERMAYFKKVVTVPDMSPTALQLDWSAFNNGDLWTALITFLYLDFLDCSGTLFSMAYFMDKFMPGFVDEKKRFPLQIAAFCADGVGIIVGSLLGIAPLTVFIESATGIREGGRTGLTALMVAFLFFLALFFTPLIASIPPYATGPALIFVGAMMMENVTQVRWNDVSQALPAFLIMTLIPFTYSIAYGVIAGLASYLALYLAFLLYDLATLPLSHRSAREVLWEAVPESLQWLAAPALAPRDTLSGGGGDGSARNSGMRASSSPDIRGDEPYNLSRATTKSPTPTRATMRSASDPTVAAHVASPTTVQELVPELDFKV